MEVFPKMLMLSANDMAVSFGARRLFAGVSLQLHSGQVTALVGPNGCGKTTLLRALAGTVEPESGSMWVRPGARMAYMPQGAAEPRPATALALCIAALAESAAGAAGPAQPLAADVSFEGQHEGTALAALARQGIGAEDARRPMNTLSAGQRARVGIACALAGEPGILLLDEPTNHLDAEGIDALAVVLGRSRAAVLVVSHDRFFLDSVADFIADLAPPRGASSQSRQSGQGGKSSPAGLRVFCGNYTAYRRQLELEHASAVKLHRQQENEERHLAESARRQMEWFRQAHRSAGQDDFLRARARKGAVRAVAASSRLERFRASRIAKPRERDKVHMDVQDASRSGRRIIVAEGIAAAYGRVLFSGLDLAVMRGDRLGIVGPNGCGKTTLLRMLAGQAHPHEGRVWISPSASVFYFDQNLDMLDQSARAVDSVAAAGAGNRENAMAALAALGIARQAGQRVASLSFGERVRLSFARMVAAGFDALILDEPTNNLDIDAREAIEAALEAWRGTLVAVSHDRYFIKRLCTQVLEFGDAGLRPPGGGGSVGQRNRDDGSVAGTAGKDGDPAGDAGHALLLENRLAVLSARLADPKLADEEKQAATEEFIKLSRSRRSPGR